MILKVFRLVIIILMVLGWQMIKVHYKNMADGSTLADIVAADGGITIIPRINETITFEGNVHLYKIVDVRYKLQYNHVQEITVWVKQ